MMKRKTVLQLTSALAVAGLSVSGVLAANWYLRWVGDSCKRIGDNYKELCHVLDEREERVDTLCDAFHSVAEVLENICNSMDADMTGLRNALDSNMTGMRNTLQQNEKKLSKQLAKAEKTVLQQLKAERSNYNEPEANHDHGSADC